MLAQPFLPALPILEKLEASGYKAYFVGGCVRDLFLGRAIHDIDIATSAKPENVQKIFPKVIPVGIEHGTVIVREAGESFEVTTFRTEGAYTDKRHPDQVAFIEDIEADLQRRDFTINALAINKDGELVDLFNGQADLASKLIRTVGDGKERFREDALRILRGLRFASQLGFTIEKDTVQAMYAVRKDIASLAVERISTEMEKLAAGLDVARGFRYLQDLKIGQELPIFKTCPALLEQIPNPIKPLPTFASFIALFHILQPEISVFEWAKAWKSSNKVKQAAEALVQAWHHFDQKGLDHWLVYRLPAECDTAFIALLRNVQKGNAVTAQALADLRNELVITTKRDLAVKGPDLIELFPEAKKGRWMHDLLLDLEKAVVDGNVQNTKNELKEWIKWNPPAIN